VGRGSAQQPPHRPQPLRGRPDLGKNGGETIRVGTSEVSMNVSRTLVEQNYFENCDGEAEIISNKSCENVYRGNTFVRNRGALTLRHGNRCIVDGNWFFGHDKPVSGGIRIIGEDHIIINNYLDGLAGEGFESAMPFVNGIPNSKPNEYFRVQRALVAYNTFVNCAQPMSFGIGKGTRNRVEPPMDCTIANNLIVGKDGPLIPLSRSADGYEVDRQCLLRRRQRFGRVVAGHACDRPEAREGR
jgi:poly(beta-D-mannuronate) lyase